MADNGGRIPTWGLLMMFIAGIVGSYLLGKQILARYRGKWPW